MGCFISMVDEVSDPDPDSEPISRITIAQWVQLVESEADLRAVASAQVTTVNGEVSHVSHEGLAVWTGYSKAGIKGPAMFYFVKGRIVSNNADHEVLHKMLSLAPKLKGKVIGPEGETYHLGRDMKISVKENPKFKKAWWKSGLPSGN